MCLDTQPQVSVSVYEHLQGQSSHCSLNNAIGGYPFGQAMDKVTTVLIALHANLVFFVSRLKVACHADLDFVYRLYRAGMMSS